VALNTFEIVSNRINSRLQRLEVVEEVINDYQEAIESDPRTGLVKQPVLYGPSPIWQTAGKELVKEDLDYDYRTDLYRYLGGYVDLQCLYFQNINQGKRKSILIRLDWFCLTERQECWSPDYQKRSANHPAMSPVPFQAQ
jgi:hypothetical protein